MKWIKKISSLHLKVPQKVPGILLNFYTELAFELDQDLLFFENLKPRIKVMEWTTQVKKRGAENK